MGHLEFYSLSVQIALGIVLAGLIQWFLGWLLGVAKKLDSTGKEG